MIKTRSIFHWLTRASNVSIPMCSIHVIGLIPIHQSHGAYILCPSDHDFLNRNELKSTKKIPIVVIVTRVLRYVRTSYHIQSNFAQLLL